MELLSKILTENWAWVSGGVLLMLLEIFSPGIFFIWLGLGAVAVGVVLSILPDLGLGMQLLVFAVTMGASVLLGARVQAWRHDTDSDGAPKLNAGLEQCIGCTAMALTDFAAEGGFLGRIALQDTSYLAKAIRPIKAGAAVIIYTYDNDFFGVAAANEMITLTEPSAPNATAVQKLGARG